MVTCCPLPLLQAAMLGNSVVVTASPPAVELHMLQMRAVQPLLPGDSRNNHQVHHQPNSTAHHQPQSPIILTSRSP